MYAVTDVSIWLFDRIVHILTYEDKPRISYDIYLPEVADENELRDCARPGQEIDNLVPGGCIGRHIGDLVARASLVQGQI